MQFFEPDFLDRLADTGRSEWTDKMPTKVMSVCFIPGATRFRTLTRFLFREEAEAIQIALVARSRQLEDKPRSASHLLYDSDTRTFGSSQFLVVEFDATLRAIRANDVWGYFRNNLGQRMTHEYSGSRVAQGGVFFDQSPQRIDARTQRDQLIFDLALLPEGIQQHFGCEIAAGIITDGMIHSNRLHFDDQARKRSSLLDEIIVGPAAIGRSSNSLAGWSRAS
jgi:hypothetical protein